MSWNLGNQQQNIAKQMNEAMRKNKKQLARCNKKFKNMPGVQRDTFGDML